MSPSLELQGAVVARLKADAALAAIIGARVYDNVPSAAQFPYVSLGYWQETPEDVDCIEGAEIFGRIDVWSRSVGKVEALRAAEAVRSAMHHAEMDLTSNALVELEWVRTDVLNDPDGLTVHAIVEVRALIERP